MFCDCINTQLSLTDDDNDNITINDISSFFCMLCGDVKCDRKAWQILFMSAKVATLSGICILSFGLVKISMTMFTYTMYLDLLYKVIYQ